MYLIELMTIAALAWLVVWWLWKVCGGIWRTERCGV